MINDLKVAVFVVRGLGHYACHRSVFWWGKNRSLDEGCPPVNRSLMMSKVFSCQTTLCYPNIRIFVQEPVTISKAEWPLMANCHLLQSGGFKWNRLKSILENDACLAASVEWKVESLSIGDYHKSHLDCRGVVSKLLISLKTRRLDWARPAGLFGIYCKHNASSPKKMRDIHLHGFWIERQDWLASGDLTHLSSRSVTNWA